MAAALAQGRTLLFAVQTDVAATDLTAELRLFGVDALRYPARETPLVHVCAASGELRAQRVAVLTRLALGRPAAIVATLPALMQRLAPPAEFFAMVESVETGGSVEPRALLKRLVRAGYERVELVEGPGQLSLRGDLLDVYCPQEDGPVRIEFFGDEIDQMRRFDPQTQRATEQLRQLTLPPAYETPQPPEAMARALSAIRGRVGFTEQELAWSQNAPCAGADALLPLLFDEPSSLFDYLPKDALLLADEPSRLEESARFTEIAFREQFTAMLERGEGAPQQGNLLLSAQEALSRLSGPRTLVCYTLARTHPAFPAREVVQFDARGPGKYLGDMEELARDVTRLKAQGESVLLFAGAQRDSLAETLEGFGAETARADALARPPVPGEALALSARLARGFAYPLLKLTVLTEAELFTRAEAPRRLGKKRKALSFSELAVGDYVVHEAHGVGRFTGIEKLTVQNVTRDYLLLEYRGGDKLYIPTDQMDRVQKYVGGGGEDTVPPLSKLGGSEWQQRVGRARESAKKLAFDLVALYAARGSVKGHAFSADSAWQKKFEERFPYVETPDQLQCIREIKADMEKDRPMDRLLCGDVGYGKTEVALRAACKALGDGMQCALLVPTTILAQQHYATAMARFADFPVRIACLSRFADAKKRQEIKKQLAAGGLDLVIGTHALLSKDVRFANLGLLIVDEEHRFGVGHKEQLKNLRQSVDVLTLSATPIPRTLNMSLSGIRDISVIETPPESRYPVQTFVLEYTDALLSDVLSRELARGGQAYVVYNRVQSMETMARKLAELLPGARIAVGHGQMPEGRLEQTMLDFYEYRADILLCSTIIESGLDIPNVNTLVVIDADTMGLAQLYQLKGRVGRSTRLGYAYFTVRRDLSGNELARKRLMAIREFTQFGAGFSIAMRDLEIRGAGSLLGAEQHGFMADIGYEYYMKLMQSAVAEARGETPAPRVDTSVDIPLDAHIPVAYIPSGVQRLAFYRRIAELDGAEARADLLDELTDRYGEPPASVLNLVDCAIIKAYASRAGVAGITVREGEAKLVFAPEAELDGGKLLLALSAEPDARFAATDPPAICLRMKNADVRAVVDRLPQFVYTITDCFAPRESI